MRVALIATSYPSCPADPAGHFVRAEARSLASQGHLVHVLAPDPFAGDPGVFAHRCGGSALLAWPGAVARLRQRPARLLAAAPFAARVAKNLKSLRPDRVVAHWAVPCGWPLALATDAPLALVCHGADVRLLLGAPRPLRERIVAGLLRADEIRFVATSLRDALLASLPPTLAGGLEARSLVRPPLVSVDEREAPPAPFARYALAAGRLVPDKRVHLAIEAVARCEGWGLVVAGEGPERASLEALARRLAPGRVRFVGLVGRPLALGYLAGASALLHPSATEAAPTVVLEALALGVPVLACGAGDTALWAKKNPLLRVVPPEAGAMAEGLATCPAPWP